MSIHKWGHGGMGGATLGTYPHADRHVACWRPPLAYDRLALGRYLLKLIRAKYPRTYHSCHCPHTRLLQGARARATSHPNQLPPPAILGVMYSCLFSWHVE